MKKLIPCALWALLLIAPVHSAAAPEHYRLTPALMQKLTAVDQEARRLGLGEQTSQDEDDDEADADEDIDDIVRRLEADPAYRALLARHGLKAMDVALAAQALLHASMYVAVEKNLDKVTAKRLYDGYTSEQKANIELLRARQ